MIATTNHQDQFVHFRKLKSEKTKAVQVTSTCPAFSNSNNTFFSFWGLYPCSCFFVQIIFGIISISKKSIQYKKNQSVQAYQYSQSFPKILFASLRHSKYALCYGIYHFLSLVLCISQPTSSMSTLLVPQMAFHFQCILPCHQASSHNVNCKKRFTSWTSLFKMPNAGFILCH